MSGKFEINPENATQLLCDGIIYQVTSDTVSNDEFLQNRVVVSLKGKLRHILCVQIALLFITGIFLDFFL